MLNTNLGSSSDPPKFHSKEDPIKKKTVYKANNGEFLDDKEDRVQGLSRESIDSDEDLLSNEAQGGQPKMDPRMDHQQLGLVKCSNSQLHTHLLRIAPMGVVELDKDTLSGDGDSCEAEDT
jgi:hypothetical protein